MSAGGDLPGGRESTAVDEEYDEECEDMLDRMLNLDEFNLDILVLATAVLAGSVQNT